MNKWTLSGRMGGALRNSFLGRDSQRLRLTLAIALLGSSMWSMQVQAQTAGITTINGGSPLTIVLGSAADLQVLNTDIPNSNGQFFPDSSTTEPASAGWYVAVNRTLFTSAVSASTPVGTQMTGVSISPVSGAGTDANPFRVTSVSSLPGTSLQLSVETRYVNNTNFFTQTATVSGATVDTPIKMFFGADIYLSTNDDGIPFRDGATGAVGGTANCSGVDAITAAYRILFIPLTAATSFTANEYSDVYQQIEDQQLNGAILQNSGCIDNGAALQWDRTVQAGRTTSVNVAVSFGDQPPADVLAPPTVTVQGQSGKTFGLAVTPGSISATVQPPLPSPPGDLENLLDSLAFTIEQIAAGGRVTLQITLPEGEDPDTAFICNSAGLNCVEIDFESLLASASSIKALPAKAGKRISFALTDGGPTDQDADPAKIGGLMVLGSKKTGSSGGGGGGGAIESELLLVLLGAALLRQGARRFRITRNQE